MAISKQYAPVSGDKPLDTRSIEQLLQRVQAEHDARVVDEIVTACRKQGNRRKRRTQWIGKAWILLLMQALGSLFLKR